MTETLRRGRKTDEVFDRAARATSHFHSFAPGTARDVDRVEPISVAEARQMFDDHRRAKMQRRGDGTHVFVVGTPVGTTRVEIEERGGSMATKKRTPAKADALETVRRLMRSTGFDEEETYGSGDDQVHFSSREEGDVLEGHADPGTVRYASDKAKEIEAAVPGAKARVEVVDEWVSITVTLPSGSPPVPKSESKVPVTRAAPEPKVRATLKPGDKVRYTNYTVGGSFQGTAIVTWDHGKSVEGRTLHDERIRLERAADGSLRRFT